MDPHALSFKQVDNIKAIPIHMVGITKENVIMLCYFGSVMFTVSYQVLSEVMVNDNCESDMKDNPVLLHVIAARQTVFDDRHPTSNSRVSTGLTVINIILE